MPKLKFSILLKLLPLVLFLILVGFFWRGLHLNPHLIPSNLINHAAPHFDLPSLDSKNKRFGHDDLIGHVSLLNVWASWCLTCRAEHPFLMQLAKDKQVTLYSLDYKDDADKARAWLAALGDPFAKTGFDADGHVAINFGVYGTPETFLIDKQGIIRYKHVGELTHRVWESKLLPLINKLNDHE